MCDLQMMAASEINVSYYLLKCFFTVMVFTCFAWRLEGSSLVENAHYAMTGEMPTLIFTLI